MEEGTFKILAQVDGCIGSLTTAIEKLLKVVKMQEEDLKSLSRRVEQLELEAQTHGRA